MPTDDFVRITGLPSLLRRLRRLEQGVFDEMLMAEIATYIITAILQRTSRGVDAEGEQFKGYHPSYRLFREETGHQGNPVNLFYSGSMLSSLTYEASEKRAEIFFQGTGDTSGDATNPEKAFFNQQERNFFSIGIGEQEDIAEIVRDWVRRG